MAIPDRASVPGGVADRMSGESDDGSIRDTKKIPYIGVALVYLRGDELILKGMNTPERFRNKSKTCENELVYSCLPFSKSFGVLV